MPRLGDRSIAADQFNYRPGFTEQLAYLSRTTEYRNTPLDAVVTFRPQVCAVLCIDRLRRDPDTVAVLANAVLPRTYRWQVPCARVSGQGARSGSNFTRSSEPASWMA